MSSAPPVASSSEMASPCGVPSRSARFGIEVAGHQDIVPVRSNYDGHIDVLYSRGIAGGNIAPHNMPPPFPSHQLKYDDVRAVEEELFDSKVLRLAVKKSEAATESAWRLRRRHTKSASFPRVKSFCEPRFLEDSTIHLTLLHPAK